MSHHYLPLFLLLEAKSCFTYLSRSPAWFEEVASQMPLSMHSSTYAPFRPWGGAKGNECNRVIVAVVAFPRGLLPCCFSFVLVPPSSLLGRGRGRLGAPPSWVGVGVALCGPSPAWVGAALGRLRPWFPCWGGPCWGFSGGGAFPPLGAAFAPPPGCPWGLGWPPV